MCRGTLSYNTSRHSRFSLSPSLTCTNICIYRTYLFLYFFLYFFQYLFLHFSFSRLSHIFQLQHIQALSFLAFPISHMYKYLYLSCVFISVFFLIFFLVSFSALFFLTLESYFFVTHYSQRLSRRLRWRTPAVSGLTLEEGKGKSKG